MRSYMIQCPFCGFGYPASNPGCPWACTTPRWRSSTISNRGWGPSWEDTWGHDHEDAFDRAAAWVYDLVDEDSDADLYGLAREEIGGEVHKPPGGDGAGGAPAYELSGEGDVEEPRIYELPADEIDATVSPTLCEALGDEEEETAGPEVCELSGEGHIGGSRADAVSGRKDNAGPQIPELAGSNEHGAPRAREPVDEQGALAWAQRVRQWGSAEDMAWGRSSTRATRRSSRPQMKIFRRGGDQEPFIWETGGMGDAEDWSWAPWAVDVGRSSQGAHDDVVLVFSVTFSRRG
ncbi:hypothetical protein RB595_000131 [Gaeumannomyces hyphopodioides]